MNLKYLTRLQKLQALMCPAYVSSRKTNKTTNPETTKTRKYPRIPAAKPMYIPHLHGLHRRLDLDDPTYSISYIPDLKKSKIVSFLKHKISTVAPPNKIYCVVQGFFQSISTFLLFLSRTNMQDFVLCHTIYWTTSRSLWPLEFGLLNIWTVLCFSCV